MAEAGPYTRRLMTRGQVADMFDVDNPDHAPSKATANTIEDDDDD